MRPPVVCVADPYLAGRVEQHGTVDVLRWDGAEPLPERAEQVQLLVPPHDPTPVEHELLASMPRLRYIQLLSRGVDHWRGHVPAGVTLCNGGDLFAVSTAELALSGILHHLHDVPGLQAAMTARVWERRPRRDLASRRVLVVGAGGIARSLRPVLEGLGATVTVVGRSARPGVAGAEELRDLLPDHDVVVLAVPLTEATAGMVDAAFLRRVPDGGILVNVARGEILDTEALLAELRRGRLKAALDVVDPEPLPPDHPLWDAPGLLISPHIGGETRGWRARAADFVCTQVDRLVAGAPLESVVH